MSEALVTNYDEIAELKGQLAELRQMLAELHEVNAELQKEIAELPKAEEMDTLVKDGKRLDWLLNNYTLSCGITREEVDEKMAKLAELRNATKAELRNATNPLW